MQIRQPAILIQCVITRCLPTCRRLVFEHCIITKRHVTAVIHVFCRLSLLTKSLLTSQLTIDTSYRRNLQRHGSFAVEEINHFRMRQHLAVYSFSKLIPSTHVRTRNQSKNLTSNKASNMGKSTNIGVRQKPYTATTSSTYLETPF